MAHAAIAAYLAAALVSMTPQQKAETVVVTTIRPGVFSGAGGVTFADQEGGEVRALRGAPPSDSARSYTSEAQALAAGRATAAALRRAGVDVDFAPVFATSDGQL